MKIELMKIELKTYTGSIQIVDLKDIQYIDHGQNIYFTYISFYNGTSEWYECNKYDLEKQINLCKWHIKLDGILDNED